jgi:hypothetical protein
MGRPLRENDPEAGLPGRYSFDCELSSFGEFSQALYGVDPPVTLAKGSGRRNIPGPPHRRNALARRVPWQRDTALAVTAADFRQQTMF